MNAALPQTRDTSTNTPAGAARSRWWILDYFPAGLFGSVMGLTGLSVAWRIAYSAYHVPIWPSSLIAIIAVADFILVSVAYVLKLVTVPRSVITEFRHPITGSLFGTIFVSMLLLPLILASYSLFVARIVWWIGAIGMISFAFVIVGRWLGDKQHVLHATPAWIIPVVGVLDLPVGHASIGPD